ncbi:FAD-binding protein [Escherichia coli]|nr:FAD-binding protein [Escherichia coli]
MRSSAGSAENALREKGYTTGHSPQSKPLAQMGGLVATRSIGQFSTLYGAIEDMVVGLEAVLADGTVTRIKNVPRRAAGPGHSSHHHRQRRCIVLYH